MRWRTQRWLASTLLLGWSAAATAAAAAHLLLPEWTAAGTVWRTSSGWQQEIAYFDILLAAAFVWISLNGDTALRRGAVLAVSALSLMLGIHHLQGWLAEPRIFHVVFTLANFAALGTGVACLTIVRENPA